MFFLVVFFVKTEVVILCYQTDEFAYCWFLVYCVERCVKHLIQLCKAMVYECIFYCMSYASFYACCLFHFMSDANLFIQTIAEIVYQAWIQNHKFHCTAQITEANQITSYPYPYESQLDNVSHFQKIFVFHFTLLLKPKIHNEKDICISEQDIYNNLLDCKSRLNNVSSKKLRLRVL